MEKGRDIRPMLEALERDRAEAERKAASARESRERMRRALSLDAPSSECVAYDPVPGSCLVTVRQFNSSLENREFPTDDSGSHAPDPGEVESLRGAVLREILANSYENATLLSAPVRDSLERIFEAARGKRTAEFLESLGEDSLRGLYRRHFAEMFQGREERNYKILASSDSAAADSLLRAPGPAWQRLGENDLPPEARGPARGLKAGETAGPIETPFARLYVRLVSARRFPDTPFEEALPALIALSAAAGAVAVPEQPIREYYEVNREEFRVPDTSYFRVWLVPGSARNGSLRERIREDTARIRPRVVNQFSLPDCVREGWTHRAGGRIGDFSGPIRSLLGTWYFRVVDIRPGRGVLSLQEARPRIMERLLGSAEPGGPAMAQETAAAKDRELWKSLAAPHLMDARAQVERNDWMHKRLSIRFIRLPSAGE